MLNRSISGARLDPYRVGAHAIGLIPAITLVLWTGCLLIGGLGVELPYERPQPPIPEPAPVIAEKIAVRLTQPPPLAQAATTAPIDPLHMPPPAASVAVAEPSPALAFALPVTGPIHVVDARHASSTRATPGTALITPAPIQTLVFGQGEGRQPAPHYPSTAVRQGQEGTVNVRLTVDTDGHVLTAEISAPCPWPLLNEAALRVIRDRWHFSPGVKRVYEVPVRFTLQK